MPARRCAGCAARGVAVLRLDKARLRLRGQGLELEGLDARLQAETVRLEYGAEHGLGDSHVEIDGAKLQSPARGGAGRPTVASRPGAAADWNILQRTLGWTSWRCSSRANDGHHVAVPAAHGRRSRCTATRCKVERTTANDVGGRPQLALDGQLAAAQRRLRAHDVPGLQSSTSTASSARARSRPGAGPRWCWSPRRRPWAWTRCAAPARSTTLGCRRCSCRWTARRSGARCRLGPRRRQH